MLEIIAHRGASYEAPENTLAALRLAWEEGADAAEGDYHVTADGHLVLAHDVCLKRIAGDERFIADCPLAELQQVDIGRWKGQRWAGERLATFADVLENLPPSKRYYVELKVSSGCVAALARALERFPHRRPDVTVISFYPHLLAAVRQEVPDLATYLIVESKQNDAGVWEPTIDDSIAFAREIGFTGLDLMAAIPIDAAAVRRVADAGLELCVWTVDDPLLARRLINAGVTKITTNRPGWLREQLMR